MIVVGIFVGGTGSRLGGVTKGLLTSPESGEPIAARLARLCRECAPQSEVLLVGRAAAYEELHLPALADAPEGLGPIGGLRALLLHARERGARCALALACDLPFLDHATLSELLAAAPRGARVPRVEGRLQPLAAAYAPETALKAVDAALAAKRQALMAVLDEIGSGLDVLELAGHAGNALRDWDRPEDLEPH